MKQYIKRVPLIMPQKVFFVALCLLIIAFIFMNSNIYETITLVLIGMTFSLVFIGILLVLSTLHKYTYTENCINILYLKIKYRKINYDCIKSIIISNAVYNDSKYDGNVFDYPLYFKRKSYCSKKEKIQYPYITLSTKNDKLCNLESGMNNRRIYYLDTKNFLNLGICWLESLAELLYYTDATVYLLEDVYNRFKTEFDEFIANSNLDNKRFVIVTTDKIPIQTYKGICN